MIQAQYLGVSEEGFHELAYTEWGVHNYELPSIICVHGYTRNSRDFDALAYYLAVHGRHIFCPDIAGRGDSAWFTHSQHYNFNQYVNDMNALIARTNTQCIDWIGTSMGGIIGMMMAALPNTPIKRLILNDIGPQIPIHGLKKLAQYAAKDPAFKSFESAKDYFKVVYRGFGSLSEDQWNYFTKHSIEQKSINKFISKIDPSIKNPKSANQWISDFFNHPHKAFEGILYDVDLWAIWEKIQCPVLVIHGEHSELLNTRIIKKMQRIHPQTKLYTKKDTGHAPALLDLVDHEIINDWLTL